MASSRFSEFTLVDSAIPEISEVTESAPEIRRVEHPTIKDYYYLVPAELVESRKWVMFGGNFGYCSDSRVNKLFGGYPLKIHDRVEEYGS